MSNFFADRLINIDSLKGIFCAGCGIEYIGLKAGELCTDCKAKEDKYNALPAHYSNASLNGMVVHDAKVLEMVTCARLYMENVGANFNVGLYLSGTVGCGKTHVAIATFKYLIDRHKSAKFTTVPELILKFRASFDKKFENEEDIIDEFVKPDYLILDDFGAEKITDYSIEMMYMIIDKRYTTGKHKIFITSNVGINQLAELTNDRIASRIVEICKVRHFELPDYRLIKSKGVKSNG